VQLGEMLFARRWVRCSLSREPADPVSIFETCHYANGGHPVLVLFHILQLYSS
jgi:hypothetical protein